MHRLLTQPYQRHLECQSFMTILYKACSILNFGLVIQAILQDHRLDQALIQGIQRC